MVDRGGGEGKGEEVVVVMVGGWGAVGVVVRWRVTAVVGEPSEVRSLSVMFCCVTQENVGRFFPTGTP